MAVKGTPSPCAEQQTSLQDKHVFLEVSLTGESGIVGMWEELYFHIKQAWIFCVVEYKIHIYFMAHD